MTDSKFTNYRENFSGRPWSKDALEPGRPESVANMRSCFDLLETTLLADGRDWILKTDKPSLADIEGWLLNNLVPKSSELIFMIAIWPIDWLVELKSSMPASVVSEKQFPKVCAWIQRFRATLEAAKSAGPAPVSLKGPEAVKLIISSEFAEPNGGVSENDPLSFREGTEVEIYPTDSGFMHHDRGRLVTPTPKEATVASRSRVGGREVRIHAPRTGFTVTKVGGGSAEGSML